MAFSNPQLATKNLVKPFENPGKKSVPELWAERWDTGDIILETAEYDEVKVHEIVMKKYSPLFRWMDGQTDGRRRIRRMRLGAYSTRVVETFVEILYQVYKGKDVVVGHERSMLEGLRKAFHIKRWQVRGPGARVVPPKTGRGLPTEEPIFYAVRMRDGGQSEWAMDLNTTKAGSFFADSLRSVKIRICYKTSPETDAKGTKFVQPAMVYTAEGTPSKEFKVVDGQILRRIGPNDWAFLGDGKALPDHEVITLD
jgi:hypothetical protein